VTDKERNVLPIPASSTTIETDSFLELDVGYVHRRQTASPQSYCRQTGIVWHRCARCGEETLSREDRTK